MCSFKKEKQWRKIKIIVTVVTPSYNRAKQLPNLYKSLICQSTLDFIWLIVDDGSTDGTEDVIRDFIEEEKNLY